MEIRLFKTEDVKELFELFRTNDFISDNISANQFSELFRCLYRETPYRWQFQIVAANQSQLLGHYGLMPSLIRRGGHLLHAGLASNLLLDEKARSAVLFLKLQSFFFREYHRLG